MSPLLEQVRKLAVRCGVWPSDEPTRPDVYTEFWAADMLHQINDDLDNHPAGEKLEPVEQRALYRRVAHLIQGNIEFNPFASRAYEFYVNIHPTRCTVVVWAEYDDLDTYTGKVERQRTRRWLLVPAMTDSEIIFTLFKCAMTSMEHRTREAFKYKGARIASPHLDVEDLVLLCRTRENAGGRHPTTD